MSPLVLWDNVHQVELNLDGIVVLGETDSLTDPVDVGIDDNSRYVKGIP